MSQKWTLVLAVLPLVFVAFAGCSSSEPGEAKDTSTPAGRKSKGRSSSGGGDDLVFKSIQSIRFTYSTTPNGEPPEPKTVTVPADAKFLRVRTEFFRNGYVEVDSVCSPVQGAPLVVSATWENGTEFSHHEHAQCTIGNLIINIPPQPISMMDDQTTEAISNATKLTVTATGWGDVYAEVKVERGDPPVEKAAKKK